MSLEILQKYKIKAKKGLGQNFLMNNRVISEISELTEVKGQNIIEVGPGYGALTEKLIELKPKSLNLVELDQDMIDVLNDRIENGDFDLEGIDFKITKKDILKYEPQFNSTINEVEKPNEKEEVFYSVIANIPYYITSPILRHFLYTLENNPKFMVILMQKEVAEKIMLNFRNKSSVLSLMIEKKADVSYEIDVFKDFFIPEPKIDSAVLLFKYNNKFKNIDDKKFLKIIKIGFTAARKMLVKNFTNSGYDKDYIIQLFNELGIDKTIRGEDLSIAEWCELVEKIND